MPGQLVLADDLSGACEAASAFLLRTTRIAVALNTAARPGEERVLALDLDSRRADASAAAASLTRALDGQPTVPAFVKVDSLLRGHVGALVRAARQQPGALVVVCPASPALGRTVLGGVVHVDRTPLHETDLWRAEGTAVPHSVAEALEGTETSVVDLRAVRGPREELVATLARDVGTGRVPVVDAETEADLDALVAAARLVVATRVLLVGAGGLAGAAARALHADDDLAPTPVPRASTCLVVVGSVAPLLRTEVDELSTVHGAQVLDLAPSALLDGSAAADLAQRAGSTAPACLVVRVDPGAPVDHAAGPTLARALADAVVPLTPGRPLVLTGGETARAVLDRLGVRSLRPVHHDRGAVTARTDDGRTVVTRPGSFGTGASLAELVSHLLTDRATTKESA
jgi:D-threonate/D-erythronate kinase